MTSQRVQRVDLTWTPDQVRDFCEAHDGWIMEIPAEWTSQEVEHLYRNQLTVAKPYIGVISEIAADARVSAETLRDVWQRFGSSPGIAAALATNLRLPDSLLIELATHEDETVREHARVTLKRRGHRVSP